jgi:IS30 family transposase
MNKLISLMEPLPLPTRKSITFDRRIEFRNWHRLKPRIGTEAWFGDPQAPWQKGSSKKFELARTQIKT